ncbi:FMN-binding glutamate synthase family protein [Effusibacillus pohliae]|uniref:FMN-binding glutamate synthase family protein n=1 Tax=Effusibacillus pohliae TaxID=232270 RepID=UPI00037AFF28|nr:FMN-binding glutamate synthase family protein [Effusibacillus pohliae]
MNVSWLLLVAGTFAGTFLSLLVAAVGGLLFARPIVKGVTAYFLKRLMKDRYAENVWEMVTAMKRISPITVLENSLRAETGKVIERPFGSPRKFLNFDGLVFSPAQLAVLPAHENSPVDTKIVIGPTAKKPLTLDIPLLLGAMGYGVGVSDKVRIAMAKATAAVGTATNTGEGGFLPEDREYAKYLIYQYHSGHWTKEPEILKQADAIEIHIGQGATAGAASFIPPEYMQGEAREILQVPPGETVVIPSRHREINQPHDLKRLVHKLRQITGGVPIGVKLCAGARLEDDLRVAVRADVDFINIDGGQAGTKGGAPILEDDFGLPTIYALCRAVRFLQEQGTKEKISLLVGGGFATPGDCLKALALGADGICLGTAALWAMTHTQVTKSLPWEPPTQLTFYSGSLTNQFDEVQAAKNLENFFKSCVEEMKVAIRALGKNSVRQVNKNDLAALDEWTSKVTNVPLAYETANRTEIKTGFKKRKFRRIKKT